jgi:hypothetical protein
MLFFFFFLPVVDMTEEGGRFPVHGLLNLMTTEFSISLLTTCFSPFEVDLLRSFVPF